MIQIFEVGPRDGLQNEKITLSIEDKVWLVESLAQTGLKNIEVGAFVRPDRVPQMDGSDLVQDQLLKKVADKKIANNVNLWYLVPNQKGLEKALAKNVKNIALFTAVSETFNKKNINMGVNESLDEMKAMMSVIKQASTKKNPINVRGYVSTVWGCPFEGRIQPKQALKVLDQVIDLGVSQISIGDTIGVANPNATEKILKPLLKSYGRKAKSLIAVHFHDTRGTALANAFKAFEMGVKIFDSSVGGLGGCPFAPGAAGNLATEDLLYLFKEMGVETGVNYKKLCEVGMGLQARMKGKVFTSKALQAFEANCSKNTAWEK